MEKGERLVRGWRSWHLGQVEVDGEEAVGSTRLGNRGGICVTMRNGLLRETSQKDAELSVYRQIVL